MSTYWARSVNFNPDPTASILDEFNRLSIHEGWSLKGKARNRRFAEACEADFDHHFQVVAGADKLQTWQLLCIEVGVSPAPLSITQCKKALKKKFVNLVNLIDHRRNPAIPLKKFRSYRQFQEYTMQGNIVSKKWAKDDGFLKVFLREVY